MFEAADACHQSLLRSYALIAVPRLAGVIGAVTLGFGFLPAVMLNQLGLGLGLVNGLRSQIDYGERQAGAPETGDADQAAPPP